MPIILNFWWKPHLNNLCSFISRAENVGAEGETEKLLYIMGLGIVIIKNTFYITVKQLLK